MHYYCERHVAEVILDDSPVKFDKELDASMAFGPDFFNASEGWIDIFKAGYYVIKWSTTSMTGFSTNGPWFEMKYFDEASAQWLPLAPVDDGSLALKSANCSGFMPFEVSKDWVATYGHYRIALFNVSGTSLALSQFLSAKATLVIYGVPYFDETVNRMLELLDQYEEQCCAGDLEQKIAEREAVEISQYKRIVDLQDVKNKMRGAFDAYYETWRNTRFMVFPSVFMVTSGTTPSILAGFPGVEICIRIVGCSYTFFLRGGLVGTPTYDASTGNYWFIDQNMCPVLGNLKYDVRFAVPVFWESATAYGSVPGLNVSYEGIYIQATNLPAGSDAVGVKWRIAFTCFIVEND